MLPSSTVFKIKSGGLKRKKKHIFDAVNETALTRSAQQLNFDLINYFVLDCSSVAYVESLLQKTKLISSIIILIMRYELRFKGCL